MKIFTKAFEKLSAGIVFVWLVNLAYDRYSSKLNISYREGWEDAEEFFKKYPEMLDV